MPEITVRRFTQQGQPYLVNVNAITEASAAEFAWWVVDQLSNDPDRKKTDTWQLWGSLAIRFTDIEARKLALKNIEAQ
jgi:hypothetical protein